MKAILFVLAATSVARADHPAQHDDELTIGTESRALRSTSADALTEDGYVGGQLTYARRLESPVPLVQLWAVGGFSWGGASGTMFQTMSTDINSVAFTAGGRARYLLSPHWAVSGKVDLGEQHASLTLEDQNGRSASDQAWGLFARAGLAIDLHAAATENIGIGLRAELDYTATRGIALSPKAAHDDSELSIMTAGASIGHLDLGGPSFTLSAITQF